MSNVAKRITYHRKCRNCGKEFATKTRRECCSRECAASLQGSGKKTTLCWACKKATTGECSWSDKFIPVEGWNATKTKIVARSFAKGYLKEETSYIVHDCPLFERG